MGGANHFDIAIDEEERHDLMMPRFAGVGELEWADTMLQDVGESVRVSFTSLGASDIDLLYSWVFVLTSIHHLRAIRVDIACSQSREPLLR